MHFPTDGTSFFDSRLSNSGHKATAERESGSLWRRQSLGPLTHGCSSLEPDLLTTTCTSLEAPSYSVTLRYFKDWTLSAAPHGWLQHRYTMPPLGHPLRARAIGLYKQVRPLSPHRPPQMVRQGRAAVEQLRTNRRSPWLRHDAASPARARVSRSQLQLFRQAPEYVCQKRPPD